VGARFGCRLKRHPRRPTKAAKGESVEANVDTGTEMVAKDNAAQFK